MIVKHVARVESSEVEKKKHYTRTSHFVVNPNLDCGPCDLTINGGVGKNNPRQYKTSTTTNFEVQERRCKYK
jgi:hypothetical protein